jgi:hypothetical protein
MPRPRWLGRDPEIMIVSPSMTWMSADRSLGRNWADAAAGAVTRASVTQSATRVQSEACIDSLPDLIKGTSPPVEADDQCSRAGADGAPLRHRILPFEAAQQRVEAGQLGATTAASDAIGHLGDLADAIEERDQLLVTPELVGSEHLVGGVVGARGRMGSAVWRMIVMWCRAQQCRDQGAEPCDRGEVE